MNYYDPAAVAAADQARTERQFIGFLSSAFGLNDQTTANQDANANNVPGQYQTVTPYGVAVEGRPQSSNQAGGALSLPLLLLLAAGAYLILK